MVNHVACDVRWNIILKRWHEVADLSQCLDGLDWCIDAAKFLDEFRGLASSVLDTKPILAPLGGFAFRCGLSISGCWCRCCEFLDGVSKYRFVERWWILVLVEN